MKNTMRFGLICASLLVGMSDTSFAQSMTQTAPATMAEMPPSDTPGHMVMRHGQRMETLHTRLKLDASQESAWKVLRETLQAPSLHANRPTHAALEKMTTPDRVDQMMAWHTRMQEAMKTRGEAAKHFYAVLNVEQKKIFDAETARFMVNEKAPHGHHPN